MVLSSHVHVHVCIMTKVEYDNYYMHVYVYIQEYASVYIQSWIEKKGHYCNDI